MRVRASLIAYFLCCGVILGTGLLYYPKWKEDRTEATLSWDVSGYYFYLPAAFIYKDLKQLEFKDEVLAKYHPTPEFLQARQWRNGNYVMKYSAGMALQYLPFFASAHAWANLTHHPPDGFSRPYQFAIFIGGLLVALIGLWLLRVLMRKYFDDLTAAVVLMTVVFATNYLDYAAINGAMSHNYLFTWYCALLLLTARYWKAPSGKTAMVIGAIIGVMVLTRPSEMLAIAIPILWGIDSKSAWRKRKAQIIQNHKHLWKAIAVMGVVGGIQIAYWMYVTGQPIVYSYEHGFKFFKPRIADGLFNFRIGWLTYSPILVLALGGFYVLYRKHRKVFYAASIFMLLFLWITLSWNEWTYGGSLGHRAMIQSYPVLAFGLAAIVSEILKRRIWQLMFALVLVMCTLYNGWLTHHAHEGGLFQGGQMTKKYFLAVLGRNRVSPETQLLLDYDEMYRGVRRDVRILGSDGFDLVQSACGPWTGELGQQCISAGQKRTLLEIQTDELPPGYLRASATFTADQKEWNIYQMPLFSIQGLDDRGNIVKQNSIRIFRVLNDRESKRLFVDLYIPQQKAFRKIRILCDNGYSQVSFKVDDVDLEHFLPG